MFEISKKTKDKINTFKSKYVHIVMIATKPDIIKQAPIYHELLKRNQQVLLIHTGQHYDFNLSGWMLKELNLDVDLNLDIKWAYHQKIAQVISRLWDTLEYIKNKWFTPIPYIHWDTMTSMTAWCSAWANWVACVHVEAWIRTLWLKRKYYKQFISWKIDFSKYLHLHRNPENFEWWQIEPYPEQYNTRCSEPASWVYLAPAEISRQNLINEGYREDRIHVVWNSISDILKDTLSKSNNSKIFEKYPLLSDWFIRFCIHRRENCMDKDRFTSIFNAIKNLVLKWQNVLLISLFATESAIDGFWLRKEVNELAQKYDNFIYSEIWPYYTDVIAAMEKCLVCATDSGSMQEEMNIMGIPTVTLRFWTDRPESCFAWWNIIAPPVSWEIIEKLISWVLTSSQMKNVWNIYWENVSSKSIQKVIDIIQNEDLFEFYKI